MAANAREQVTLGPPAGVTRTAPLGIVATCVLAALGCGGAPATLIQHVTVIPVSGAPPLADAAVLIRGERIVAVGPSGSVVVPRGARVVDASGRFLIPGLFEMHSHLSKARASALALYVVHGVTTARDMGGDHDELLTWRREIRVGGRLGPRLLIAGPYLESERNVRRMRATPPDEMIEPVERTRIPIGSPQRARHVVDSLAQLELDFLKLRVPQDRETYLAIGDAARHAGLDLIGHVYTLDHDDVLRAGQRGIEHVWINTLDTLPRDARMRLWRRFATAGVGVVPTLSTFVHTTFARDDVVRTVLDDSLGIVEPRRRYLSKYLVDDWREQALERNPRTGEAWRELWTSTLRNLREMHEAGVRIMTGSDVAALMIFPGSTLHDEMELFVDSLDMTPLEVLARATRLPAEFLGIADSVGSIEPGKVADLVLLDGDPLRDIANVRRIAAVVLRGRLFDRRDLDSILVEVDRAPDQSINDWPRVR